MKSSYLENYLTKLASGDFGVLIAPNYLKKRGRDGRIAGLLQTITNNMKEKNEALEILANGGTNVTDVMPTSGDLSSEYIRKIANSVNSLKTEVNRVKNEVMLSGDLNTRVDIKNFDGDFRQIAEGLNGVLEATTEPLGKASTVLRKMSAGNFTEHIDGDFKGSFKELFDEVNFLCERLLTVETLINDAAKGDINAIQNIAKLEKGSDDNGFIPSLQIMVQTIHDILYELLYFSKEIDSGHILDARCNEVRFTGIFKQIINEFNNAVGSIRKPFSEMAEVLSAISVNDYTLKMKTDYVGDIAVIAGITNALRERLLNLLEVAGKIATGDISMLEEFQKRGKRSENDVLTPTCTKMMETIQDLISEITLVAKSASNGELNVRCAAEKFEGGYASIINAINDVLDSVEKPVNEVTEVMDRMKKTGALGQRVEGNYNGKFREQVNSINATISSVELLVKDVSFKLSMISRGDFSIERARDYMGDYRALSDAINLILDSLNGLLGNITVMADSVASGSLQVSQGSKMLSQGASEQTSSVEQLKESVARIAEQTIQNQACANEANLLVSEVKANASEGNCDMEEMLQKETVIWKKCFFLWMG
jgi:methyl-accepting chemotaxis protein